MYPPEFKSHSDLANGDERGGGKGVEERKGENEEGIGLQNDLQAKVQCRIRKV